MCRIFGYFKTSGSIEMKDVSNCSLSLNLLAHGGPDDHGSFYDLHDGVYLGHRRLSILDLSELGHQPMQHDKYIIVYNGEIYNFREVKEELIQLGQKFTTETDTEVILKSFQTWQYKSVEKFRGMFAFAIWDTVSKQLILCRDRLGIKPLYFYNYGNQFIFSSELKAISKFPDLDLQLDMCAVSLYLKVGYIKSPYSIYRHVKKLNPGHFLQIDCSGEIKTWSYWSANHIKTRSSQIPDEEILEEAEKLLLENSAYRMVSDVPVGVFLSGGVDSSLVAAMLSQQHRLKTFTIGFEDKEFNEAVYAKAVANYLQTDHNELILTEDEFKKTLSSIYEIFDEPFGDSSAIPTYLVSSFAKQQVTVALSADGGDEVFGGYDRYLIAKSFQSKVKYLPVFLRKVIASSLGKIDTANVETILDLLHLEKYKAGIHWRYPKLLNGISASNVVDFYEQSQSMLPNAELEMICKHKSSYSLDEEHALFDPENIISSLGKIDLCTYLEGDILTKVDRATMAVALEGREPLLDHTLVEFGLSLPDKYKCRDGNNKWVLRTLLNRIIPSNLVDRPKKGFSIPVHKWLKTILKDDLMQMLADVKFSEEFQLNQKYMQSKINQFINGKGNMNPHFVWNLHMLYKWYLINRA